MQIYNLAVMPVCSKCHYQMITEELKLDEQAAIVACSNKGCEEHGSRYRVVVPSMYGSPVHAS